ncbi:hypothetical protein RhiirA1_460187 [Rhizophagus irregularis]|uniref:Uncharacterized protein n=1 Tax=Rhizophagus irregularis TaxID=588596 RepID=A0A2N0RS17_9GLOM|nr:hypothetical protein RhiirA1_460187 [Rhizophagus irregularis]
MISENKENDRKSHKLDDDGGVRSIGIKPVRFREHLVIDLVVVIGLIIVEVKDYRSAIIIPWTENILMEIRNRVGNVLFPYTMNRIVFDIIGSGYLPRDSKRCTCQIILTPHQDMVEQSLLYYAYKKNIRNTCVVFANQPSLCSGESINFIRNWENNSNIQ